MTGRYYEDLDVDAVYAHEVRRTVTETDNLIFTALSMNPQPLHLDHEFARASPFGKPLVNSLFTLATIGGLSVYDLTLGTTLGNLGYERIRFPHPVFVGDTLRAETKILDKRLSKSNPSAGVVRFLHIGYTQHDDIVLECERIGLMQCRPETQ